MTGVQQLLLAFLSLFLSLSARHVVDKWRLSS